jgi:alpha-tubulin suppressor-like RCC1 family protein
MRKTRNLVARSAPAWLVLAAAASSVGCGDGGTSGRGGGAAQSSSASSSSTSMSTGEGGSSSTASAGGSTGAFGIDECTAGTSDCSPDAICTDTPAFYTCACKPGFQGDGHTCADVNECTALLSDCDANAVCTNTPGAFSCACGPGFIGDGKSCEAMYTAVSAGQYHACAVRADKTMWCWGLNTSGQVGTGTGDVVFLRPAAAGSASDWTRVSAGAAFSCGLNTSGQILCWGANSTGQIGDGTGVTALTPTPLMGGVTDWISFDSGNNHSCAIRANGELSCWGTNTRGQIGDGSTTNALQPVVVSAGPWSQVSVGSELSCAVRADHTLWCWGLNTSKQLGNGLTTNSSLPVQEKTLSTSWASVTAGNAFACGVQLDGTRWCWGTNTLGQGGDGTVVALAQPTKIGAESDWTTIDAGDFAACGLRGSGALSCWGDGSLGQTAQPGNESPGLAPASVGVATDWTAVTGGLRFACGIHGGKLACWGSASHAALGLGYTSDRTDPTLASASTDFTRLAVQMDDGCAIHATGELSCWGRNAFGNLGDGTMVSRAASVPVGAGKLWQRVTLGRNHACGIATDNNVNGVYCWGTELNQELGNGVAVTNQLTPGLITPTPGNTSAWTEIAAGLNYTCALRQDGTLWCWGRNTQGQLGDTTTTARADPKQVLPLGAADWVEISASGEFTCARRASGALFCWGRNDVGQLGAGDVVSPVSTPKQVGTATYSAVSAGQNHACAVATDGTLWCWGRNASGELGLGNAVGPVLVPTQVGTDTDWLRPALGQGLSTCATKKNGDLYCWGVGSYGQLGRGNLTSFNKPQKVSSVTPWLAIALGNEHACGLGSDGRLSCWGASNFAQLGSGVPFVSTPTAVLPPP